MARVAFHGLHEIGNQVIATFELNVDVRPGVVALDLKADESVVHPDDKQDEKYEDCENNPTQHQATSFLRED